MGKKLILGSFIGAVIVFVWMMISWMVLPWHGDTMKSFSNPEHVRTALMESTSTSGIYVYPGMSGIEAAKEGPVIFTAIRREGFNFESPLPYISAFIIQWIGAFIITLLLLMSHIRNYFIGVLFVALIGLGVGVLGELPKWNWWGFSLDYVGVAILDLVIAWFLAGLILSIFCRNKVDVNG